MSSNLSLFDIDLNSEKYSGQGFFSGFLAGKQLFIDKYKRV